MRIRILTYYLIVMIFLSGVPVVFASSDQPSYREKEMGGKDVKLYVIGMGAGAADLVTLRAIDYLKRSDVVICRDETAVKYKDYLQGKELLSLPLFPYWESLQKKCSKPSHDDIKRCEELIRKRKERASLIRKYIKNGKTVALLEGGDPCIFGCLRWIKQEFSDDEFEVVPGISAFNVANALLKREVADAYIANWQTRTVILTTPTRKGDRMDSVDNLAKHRSTMVFFMPREFEEKILPTLKNHYPPNTPVAIVYKAGFPDEQQVVKGTLDDFPAQPPEKRWLRLIYIGEFLKDASQYN